MASPKFNTKSPTIKRILREAAELSNTPSADYHASPATDSDLFDWHFTIRGPSSTLTSPSPYSDGIYHGRIVLPPTYPLRPPSFRFLTPSGRFEVNREICLSISGHHEETWQPAWGIRTALVALRAFMETDAKGQLGGLEVSNKERGKLAQISRGWKCGVCGRSNEEILRECEEAAKGQEVKEDVIPDDLKMGWKDELGGGAKQNENQDNCETEEELAEGFVRTAEVSKNDTPPTTPESSYTAARPVQSVSQATASIQQHSTTSRTQTVAPATTTPAQLPATTYPAQTQLAERRSSDGVPLWIDRSIAGVVICLVIMVMKMLLGL